MAQDPRLTGAVGDPPATLMAAAVSPRWEDRVLAARGLARYARQPAVAALLRRLLVDAEDSAVTYQAAEALLARDDSVGVALVLWGLAHGDRAGDEANGDWILDAVRSRVAADEGSKRLVELLGAATTGTDPEVAREARLVLDWLGADRR